MTAQDPGDAAKFERGSKPPPLDWAWTRLQLGQAGIDSVIFRAIAEPLLDAGIYLSEHDLSYFGVEGWGLSSQIECFPGKDEIPCIYSVSRGTKLPLAHVESVFPLVDLVFRTTGGGVGITLLNPVSAPSCGLTTDPRTGARVRYSVTPFSKNVYWVGRTEAGRGPSSLSTSADHTMSLAISPGSSLAQVLSGAPAGDGKG
jgi:hypothetical protein